MRARQRNPYDHTVGFAALPLGRYRSGRGLGIRDVAALTLLTGLTVILAWLLVAADLRSDLSTLKPLGKMSDPSLLVIGWPELRRFHDASGDPALRCPAAGVRMLGYMMLGPIERGDGTASDGKEIDTFVLTPGAGPILRRHGGRNPDQMVEIRLRRSARFRSRELVWVSGRIEPALIAPGDNSTPSYVMKDSEVSPAEQREITRWFTP